MIQYEINISNELRVAEQQLPGIQIIEHNVWNQEV